MINETRKYRLNLSDHRKTIRAFISFGIAAIVIIIVLSLYVGTLDEKIAPKFFFIGIGSTMIGGPLLLLLYFYGVIIKRTNATLSLQGIETNIGIHIPYSDIKDTQKVINHNGYNTLFILRLKNGKKYSISPTNKYRRLAMCDFNEFVSTVEQSLISNIQTK